MSTALLTFLYIAAISNCTLSNRLQSRDLQNDLAENSFSICVAGAMVNSGKPG